MFFFGNEDPMHDEAGSVASSGTKAPLVHRRWRQRFNKMRKFSHFYKEWISLLGLEGRSHNPYPEWQKGIEKPPFACGFLRE